MINEKREEKNIKYVEYRTRAYIIYYYYKYSMLGDALNMSLCHKLFTCRNVYDTK